MNDLIKLLELYPDKPWNYYHLSYNPNITWEIVQKFPDKPWDYDYLSENPNITWEIIQANPYKPWNWEYLSYNEFNYKQKQQEIKRNHAAKIIQDACHNWLWKPITKDGKLGINAKIGLKELNIERY
jgi:hypothetical protein